MLYVFLTCLTSEEGCADSEGCVVLRTEKDIEHVCRRLQKTKGVCLYSINWKKFTKEERKVVEELFAYHTAVRDKVRQTGETFEVVCDKVVDFNEGDKAIQLIIDDHDYSYYYSM